jgi:peptidoglycan/xylan/chitin deacetylase (PgdA/CDA1 family)
MLKDMKLITLRVLANTGMSRALSDSRWRKDRLLILGYHGISQDDEHLWNPALYVTPQQFRVQLATIRQHGFTVLGLDEAVARLYSGKLPERALSITFDDGNVDFYRQAYPILREHGYPVALYLTTYYCFNNKPVFPPALAYILWKSRLPRAPYPRMLDAAEMMELETPAGRDRACQRIVTFAEREKLSAADKHELLADVAASVGYPFETLLSRRLHHLMNPEEVAEVAADGVDVQMHAHRHRRPLDRDDYRREIRENRAAIEAITGRRPVHFCYPVGHTHPWFLPWLAEEGVASATTCNVGLAGPHSNPLLLPRVICTARLTPLEFSAWLAGAAALLPHRRHVPLN